MLRLSLLTVLLLSANVFAQTFNAVEKSKDYKMAVTGIPVDFEEEEIDPAEAALYNAEDDEEVLDEYDIPEMVVDTLRGVDHKQIKKAPLLKAKESAKILNEN